MVKNKHYIKNCFKNIKKKKQVKIISSSKKTFILRKIKEKFSKTSC